MSTVSGSGSSDTPNPRHCECGHQWCWYTTGNAVADWEKELLGDGAAAGLKQHTDVIERHCPHRNGTHIQYCPKCDAQLAMWGAGAVGSMECECWETKP